MMRTPDLAEIHAAELRVAESKLNTLESLRRVPGAFHAALTRPSTMLLAMGAAGLWGFCMARRARATSSSDGAAVARPPSVAALGAAFIVRFAMQYLTSIFRHVWTAREERAGRVGTVAEKSSPAYYSATGLRQ